MSGATEAVLYVSCGFLLALSLLAWIGLWGQMDKFDDLKARLDRIERGGRR